ncbi:MAG: hypothetical protein QOH48_1437 [Actinomycetota bacterium]|jgi:hypothetical protein|nr:hypothetical protein [Actinomycetota bacterium]
MTRKPDRRRMDRRTDERRSKERARQDRRARECRQDDRLASGILPTERVELAGWLEAMLEHEIAAAH